MKLSLEVLAEGKMKGKKIAVTVAQFIIGRDAQCHLRPASPMISNRHCALLTREGQVFVRDFNSTNGTFVNERQFKGEIELMNGDSLKAGPLAFRVHIEASTPVDKPTPLPVNKAPAAASEDEEAAAMLLSMHEDGSPPPQSADVDPMGIPTGSTIMDMVAPGPAEGTENLDPGTPASKDPSKPAPPKSGDTSSAAKTILEKYMRRPRS